MQAVSRQQYCPGKSKRHEPKLDSFERYLREINEFKLLTPKEEVALAKRSFKGDEAAIHEMIQRNLRLVVTIAQGYEGRGLPLLDLINEGNLGLRKAVERFDPAFGGRLSTYASRYIKQYILKALSDSARTIRLPRHILDTVGKVMNTETRLHGEFGRAPSAKEIGASLGLKEFKVEAALKVALPPVSLDGSGSFEDTDDAPSYHEMVGDTRGLSPDLHVAHQELLEDMRRAMKSLDARERKVLKLRFELAHGTKYTLDEVGEEIGLTRERARQIQEEALEKLAKKIAKIEKIKEPRAAASSR